MKKRRSAREWQALIKEQESSGETTSVYCATHGLNEKYFSVKRWKLKRAGGGVEIDEKFIEIPVGGLSGMAAFMVEVDGMRIHVNAPALLKSALKALKESRC